MQTTFCQLIDEVESRLPELFAESALVTRLQLDRAFPEVDRDDVDDALTVLVEEGKLCGHCTDHHAMMNQDWCIWDSNFKRWYAGVARK